MDIEQFFSAKDVQLRPVFVLTKDVEVIAYLWEIGNDPRADPQPICLPVGTELFVNECSNFGDGYSMMPVNYKSLFKGMKKRANRWVRINYADMEYSHHIVLGSVVPKIKLG